MFDRSKRYAGRDSAYAAHGGEPIHIEDLESDHHDPFHHPHEPHTHHRWLLTTCVAGVAGSLVIGSALLGIFSEPQVSGSALASVSPAEFWQQRSQVSLKGDYNGEIASAVEMKPYSEITTTLSDNNSGLTDFGATASTDVVLPARGAGESSYPGISADVLPYGDGSKTVVLDASFEVAAVDTGNITTIAKTPPPEPTDHHLVLAAGDTLSEKLIDLGVAPEAARRLSGAIEPVYPNKLIKAGMAFDVTLEKQQDFYGNDAIYPVRVSFNTGPDEEVVVESDEDGQFAARIDGQGEGARSKYAEFPQYRAEAKVGSSLYATAKDQGIPDYIITEMMRVYSYLVDFQRQVRAGDDFQVFYGNPISGTSTKRKVLLYSALEINGQMKSYYRFTTPDDGQTDYYDENGLSATRGLLRTPVSGAHLTSGFGMRVHPLLGYSKMHAGVDFGVPYGTPIKAAGNGIIEVAGRNGGYGNMVKIDHERNYETVYAHMSRIADGIAPGTRVRQGQIIGYVGSTGRSTGPHLHFEVRIKDKPVNPLNVQMAGGRQLSGKNLSLFRQHQQKIMAMMKTAPKPTQVAAAQ